MNNVNPNIENLTESDEAIQAAITKTLEKAWERIPKKYFVELIKLMNNQINAVKLAKELV